MTRNEIITCIKDLNLPANQYWVNTGAGLVLHNVKSNAGDIDIGCTHALFSMLQERGWTVSKTSDGKGKLAFDNIIEVFEDWAVDEVVVIDGISVASLPSIRKTKAALGREKDMADIRLIDSFLSKSI